MNLGQLTSLLFSNLGCEVTYVKELSENDNSKNQVYLGGDYSTIQMLPFGEIDTDNSDLAGSKRPRFKVSLDFSWITDEGQISPAPETKLILYPDYPEVRFSGFLRGCNQPPSELMTVRLAGRMLFLGVDKKAGKIYGYVCAPNDPLKREVLENPRIQKVNLFYEINPTNHNDREILLDALYSISQKGWIDSKRLDKYGNVIPCTAPQCGGYTLEAELGIIPNGRAEPDFEGWELKQYASGELKKNGSKAITLITPEPDGGIYKNEGFTTFMNTYGYPDKNGIEDRINFGGLHFVNDINEKTGLKLILEGYDDGKIINTNGYLGLIDTYGNIAASWSFSGFLSHWNRKHAKVAYVPSEKRLTPNLQYRFLYEKIILGEGSDFGLLLKGFDERKVYYDPGLKIENISTKPSPKKRNQFRIKASNLGCLYKTFEMVE